jgi:DNA-binding transcriptional LysR family regulator
MDRFTLHELQCFDAVARIGSFQAAATQLHRTHPAVFASVSKLERKLGLQLLDVNAQDAWDDHAKAARALRRRG